MDKARDRLAQLLWGVNHCGKVKEEDWHGEQLYKITDYIISNKDNIFGVDEGELLNTLGDALTDISLPRLSLLTKAISILPLKVKERV